MASYSVWQTPGFGLALLSVSQAQSVAGLAEMERDPGVPDRPALRESAEQGLGSFRLRHEIRGRANPR